VVTLTETGTHSSIDARVGGFSGGEPELAVAMAGSAAGMLVIMDRGFPGVVLWKAYTRAGAHLLIRARSSVARRPVQVLDDGTYLARMNPAGQKSLSVMMQPPRRAADAEDVGRVMQVAEVVADDVPVGLFGLQNAARSSRRVRPAGSLRTRARR
jgi:hypothetical protein